MASERQPVSGADKRKRKKLRDDARAVHHFQVSPCVIIVKYGKCAANLMVSLCIYLELADVIANVSTLKYVIT